MQPPPPPSASPKTSPFRTYTFWLIIGGVFAVLQFGVSETLHRLGMLGMGPDETMFYDLSNAVAWPAGELYDIVQVQLQENALHQVAAGGEPFTEEQQRKAQAFLEQFPEFPLGDEDREPIESFLWEIDELFDPMTVSVGVEYGIYIGTCACWGFLISLGGYLLFRKIDDPAI